MEKDRFILNIGLNVGNTEPKHQLTKSLFLLMSKGVDVDLTIDNVKIESSSYGNIVERVLICYCSGNLSSLDQLLPELSEALNQDCIAYFDQYTERGELIYRPNFEGEKFGFDLLYFKK